MVIYVLYMFSRSQVVYVKHSDLFVKDMSVSDMQTVFSSFQCDMEDTAPFQ